MVNAATPAVAGVSPTPRIPRPTVPEAAAKVFASSRDKVPAGRGRIAVRFMSASRFTSMI